MALKWIGDNVENLARDTDYWRAQNKLLAGSIVNQDDVTTGRC